MTKNPMIKEFLKKIVNSKSTPSVKEVTDIKEQLKIHGFPSTIVQDMGDSGNSFTDRHCELLYYKKIKHDQHL